MDTWKYFPTLCWKALQKWKALLSLVSVIRGVGSKPGIVLRFSAEQSAHLIFPPTGFPALETPL